jgi:3-oxoacyl-[acyl-carrier-protein] synthase-3
VAATQRALTDAALLPREIDALLFAGALPLAHQRRANSRLRHHSWLLLCGSWLQEELGLDRATVSGIAQQGCAGMFSALRVARALLIAEPQLEHVLCVGADALPSGACREILYNVISDAACAAIVSRTALRHRWLAFHQISKGYYWTCRRSSGDHRRVFSRG